MDPICLQLNPESTTLIRWGRTGQDRSDDGTPKRGATCDFYCESVYRSKFAFKFPDKKAFVKGMKPATSAEFKDWRKKYIQTGVANANVGGHVLM